MEKIEQIIIISANCLGLLATIIGFIIPLVKNIKAKNKLTALKNLTSTLQSLIIDAESFTNFTGAEKKEYVMTRANRYAIENKIPYNEKNVSDKVEELIAVSNKVNIGKTSKENKTVDCDKKSNAPIRI